MYYIGLDVYKKTISHCVKDVSGQVHWEFSSQSATMRDGTPPVGVSAFASLSGLRHRFVYKPPNSTTEARGGIDEAFA
jgi:hypothetical protein